MYYVFKCIYGFGLYRHCTKNEVFHQGFLKLMRPNPQFPADLVTSTFPADLVTLTEKILNGKLIFYALWEIYFCVQISFFIR